MKYALIIGLFFLPIAASAGVFGTVVSKQTDWTIYKDQDAMTDKISCIALYKDQPSIQLTYDSLAISLRGRGGVEAYQYRLDDQVSSGLQLASQTEKEISAIIFQGSVFDKIKLAKRFRVDVLTVLNSTVDEDVNLAALPEVISYLVGSNCK